MTVCRTPRTSGVTGFEPGRIEDGCQRNLCRVFARAARTARPCHAAAHVRQERRVLRWGDAGDGDENTLYFRVDDQNRETFREAEAFPPLNYAKRGEVIDLAFWRVPERLFDEPDEFIMWARAALAAAHRIAAKRPALKQPKAPGQRKRP